MPTAPNTVLIHAGPVFSYKHTNTKTGVIA